jgi:hypothetical protein
MLNHSRRHLSYLLRLWPVCGEEETTWRAALENVHTGEILGFATVTQLQCFLEMQTAVLAAGESAPPLLVHKTPRNAALP